jgi:hypothetical protein
VDLEAAVEVFDVVGAIGTRLDWGCRPRAAGVAVGGEAIAQAVVTSSSLHLRSARIRT